MKSGLVLFGIIIIIVLLGMAVTSYGQGNPNNPQSFATISVDVVQSMTNQYNSLRSYNYAFIFNNNPTPAIYTYYFQLCAPMNGCTIKNFAVTLQGNQSIEIPYILQWDNIIWSTAGLYTLTGTVNITGPSTNVNVTGISYANVILPYYNNALP